MILDQTKKKFLDTACQTIHCVKSLRSVVVYVFCVFVLLNDRHHLICSKNG